MNKKDTKYLIIVIILFAIMLSIIVFNYLREGIYGKEEAAVGEKSRKELSVVHWIDIPGDVIDAFEKEYPDIKVKYYKYHKETYQEAIASRIRDGLPIDVVGIRQDSYQTMAEKDQLIDLTNKAFLQSYKDDVREGIKMKSASGEYAVGLSSTYYGIWYNKDLFAEYNLAVPTTYEELKDLCDTLQLHGERSIGLLGMDERLSIARQLVGSSADASTDASTDASAEKFELESDAVKATYQQAFKEFKKGKYAMLATPNESIKMCGWDMEAVFEPGVFAIPFQDKNGETKTPVILADNLTGVMGNTNKREESFLFLNFLSRSDIAGKMAAANSWISTVSKSADPDVPYYKEWQQLAKQGVCDISYLLR